ncbi:MAG: DVU0150 family protein [Solidesulfovibrio sp. DCME]|uniref:DVU0150 family protein n=1 Tax=Solidesulfovibrio sp. DCME TaxID=3447380 RepID=UPI003D13000A
MLAKWKALLAGLTTFLLLAPAAAFAAGGGGAPIVIVADTRKLTGVMAWWANLYNESHLYFTILTVILIPLIGVIFGVLADIIMHFIGIDLKSRDLAEH